MMRWRKRVRRLWDRYNPRRTYVDLDDDLIAVLSQLGYVELYRGEYFFTDAGIEALKNGVRIMKEQIDADVRS